MTLGITATQQRTLEAILAYVALYGAVPSLATLANTLQCQRSNVSRTIARLVERKRLSRMPDGSLAIGAGGVMVNVPRGTAAKLAAFCAQRGEQVSAVVADAITLHIDDVERG